MRSDLSDIFSLKLLIPLLVKCTLRKLNGGFGSSGSRSDPAGNSWLVFEGVKVRRLHGCPLSFVIASLSDDSV